MKIKLLFAGIIAFWSYTSHGQKNTSDLVLSEIMAGNDFIGIQPDNFRWSFDNQTIYFSQGKDDWNKVQWFAHNINNGETKKLNSTEAMKIPKSGYLTDDNHQHWYFKNGPELYRCQGTSITKVFSFYEAYAVEKVFTDGTLLMTVSNQIVQFDPNDGTFIQLVKKVPPIREDKESFLTNQQDELFDIIEKRNDQKVLRESSRLPQLEEENSISWIEMDDNKYSLLYMDSDYPKTENTQYASYVTENGETKLRSSRAKVGRPDPKHKLYMIDMRSNMHFTIDISGLSGIDDRPDYFKYYPELKHTNDQKKVIYHNHGASPDGKNFLVEIKSYDNKDRWICTINPQGELSELDHQRDTAWIGGPGITGWTSVGGNVGWVNSETVFFQSEESGYSHLYTYDLIKEKKTQLTEGRYEIHEAILSHDRSKFWITANHNHPGNREFYSLDIKSKRLKGILTTAGNHQVRISPDESQLAIRYSYINKPWEIYVAKNEEQSEMKQITESQSEAFKSYNWREPAVINFEASDGKNVAARMYFPENEKKNGAGVIFVHGAGYLQNAHNWWSGYYREYMFHNMLADLGYTVMDIDYRASKGYGRDHRTAIYRHMGGKDLSDQVDGRQFLIDTYNIDPERVGIYGGSYGGFITLMALLTEPGKFKCGAALRSVTDWAHYNHPYTSNILNTPEYDPKAFEISSPIYFAENLEDKLIMLHGMEDGNVQYQDVVRLSQRFIELGKTDWDLIGYPIESHGFKETSSWTDEYRRILELFETELN